MRVLLVEDDPGMASSIARIISDAGWAVEVVDDGERALKAASASPYDVLVVDRMLPKLDGLTVLKRLRSMEIATPALILSALSGDSDKVAGLDGGADDYLIKPFSAAELLARLRALRRRAERAAHPEVLIVRDLEIWTKACTAVRGGKPLNLSDTEFKLLLYFAQHEGSLVTRKMILQQVFDLPANFDPGTNVVEVAISRLRSKLDKGFDVPLLGTKRRRGYVFNESTDSA